MKMKKWCILPAVLLAAVLSGCAAAPASDQTDPMEKTGEAKPAYHQINQETAKQMMAQDDYIS